MVEILFCLVQICQMCLYIETEKIMNSHLHIYMDFLFFCLSSFQRVNDVLMWFKRNHQEFVKFAIHVNAVYPYNDECWHYSSDTCLCLVYHALIFCKLQLQSEDHQPFTDLVFGHYDVDIANYEGDPVSYLPL